MKFNLFKQQQFYITFLIYLNKIVPLLKINIYKNSIILITHPFFLENLLLVLKKHTNFQFSLLSTISGIDYLYKKNRFAIVYDLLSLSFSTRIRIKTFIHETSIHKSIQNIYLAATWWEREIWDLFGIFFTHNIEIKRILTDYGFEGHPLRKDFPLSGFVETRYDEQLKRVVCEPLEHLQEFRVFNFSTGWLLKDKNS